MRMILRKSGAQQIDRGEDGSGAENHCCGHQNWPGAGPGQHEHKRLIFKRLGGLDVFILLKDTDRGMFTENCILGDQDFLDLLL